MPTASFYPQWPAGWGPTGYHTPTATAPSGTTSLPTGPVTGYDPAYGGVPTVPSPQGTQTASILGNVGNLASLYQLATGAGRAAAGGAGAALSTNFPGALPLISQAGGNTGSLLSGQLPPDVVAQLSQQAAERGAASGLGSDSPAIQAGLLRSLGLTSLGLQQQGLGNLGSLIGMTPTGPAFNPASQFVTPTEQQAAQTGANVLGAAPIPASAAAANMNALQAALAAGRGATGPQTQAPGTTTGSTGAAALGYQSPGFGVQQTPTRTLTGTLGQALASSNLASSEDPTSLMSPQEQELWNSMTPDQQYEEQLMGYPSFFGSTELTPAGSDTSNLIDLPDTSTPVDFSSDYSDVYG